MGLSQRGMSTPYPDQARPERAGHPGAPPADPAAPPASDAPRAGPAARLSERQAGSDPLLGAVGEELVLPHR